MGSKSPISTDFVGYRYNATTQPNQQLTRYVPRPKPTINTCTVLQTMLLISHRYVFFTFVTDNT